MLPSSSLWTKVPVSSSCSFARAQSAIEILPPARRTHVTKRNTIDVADMASRLGVHLSKDELSLLRKKLDKNKDGVVTRSELYAAGQTKLEDRWVRELFLRAIEQPRTVSDRMGDRLVNVLDYGGTALFAVVGTQIAGEVGMNVVGCLLVGCIAAMGGGTVNNLLYGSSSPIMGSDAGGVFWVRKPAYLATALAASTFTFFAWPEYCRSQAERELVAMLAEAEDGRKGMLKDAKGNIVVDEACFVATCQHNPEFLAGVKAGLGLGESDSPNLRELFRQVDLDRSGLLNINEIQKLVAARFDASGIMYALDTLALSGFAVAAVHGAIGRGLHPLVSATSGVTICFGGIIRDILCHREEIALGSQSYALATGAGSTLYVVLRELGVRGIVGVPFVGRILFSAGTVVFLRWWEWVRGIALLSPMHGDRDR